MLEAAAVLFEVRMAGKVVWLDIVPGVEDVGLWLDIFFEIEGGMF
jgi:hypothetical protein